MNGPEHFREAEHLLEAANDCSAYDEAAGIIAQAQVHATLALAAATAYPAVRDWMGDEARDGRGWSEVTS